MGNISELVRFQKIFDSKHVSTFKWNDTISDNNIHMLLFLVSSLAGESGEAINIVKKIVRGDMKLHEAKEHLEEELADVFIYLLKLSYQLDFDLEKAYYNKMKKNEEKFLKYEQQCE